MCSISNGWSATTVMHVYQLLLLVTFIRCICGCFLLTRSPSPWHPPGQHLMVSLPRLIDGPSRNCPVAFYRDAEGKCRPLAWSELQIWYVFVIMIQYYFYYIVSNVNFVLRKFDFKTKTDRKWNIPIFYVTFGDYYLHFSPDKGRPTRSHSRILNLSGTVLLPNGHRPETRRKWMPKTVV